MKGPSLHNDVRVLRVFCCDACGRQVQTPGHVTSHTCQCSDPPKFMRPLERPRTVSPDVSRFLSPADPSELIEVDEIDETPYVLHVPIKPPPPARFANRRKLYDETSTEAEPDFGDGIASDTEDDAVSDSAVSAEEPLDNSNSDSEVQRTPQASGNRDRSGDHSRRRRGRGGARRADSQVPGAAQQDQRSSAAGSRGTKPTPPRKRDPRPMAEESSRTQNSNIKDDAVAPRDAEGKSQDSEKGEGRQRSRRRGRRRGPRPEGSGA